MIQYPLYFESRATAKCGINSIWDIASGENSALCSIPPEFEGAGGGFSPEDLFAQALTNCFIATFKVICEHSKVTFKGLEVVGRLTVDKDETRRPVMKHFQLHIKIQSASHPERAETILAKAVASGFILNSVKTKIDFDFELE